MTGPKKPPRPPYQYKTTPRGKQLDAIENTWHERVWAMLCRPGTGKTKMLLDTAGMLYMANEIDAVIVLAPNGVHRQWVKEQIPKHLPDSVPWMGGFYDSGMGVRAFERLARKLRSRDMGLRVLTASFEGVQTKRGDELARALMVGHRTLLVIDESHRLSNTKGTGHKAILKLAGMARYRRIATGTLVKQNPFSIYGQFELLGHALLGYTTLTSFKSMYAEMLPPTHGLVKKIAADFKARTGKAITPQIQAKGADDRPIYRNLPHLRRLLEHYSIFMTLEDVQGAEPLVVQSTRYVTLTAEQRAVYDPLEQDGVAQVGEGILTAEAGMTLALRLQQIVGGFTPNDDDPTAQPIPGENPKLVSLLDYLEEVGPDEKVVIWARFHTELELIAGTLQETFGRDTVAEYHGRVPHKARDEAKGRFLYEPGCRYFVGQIRAGGTGLDGLQGVSSRMVFFSNEYSYTDRDQAVSRLARSDGPKVVSVVDIVAEDTTDFDVVNCMQAAQDVHEAVLFRNAALRRAPVLED